MNRLLLSILLLGVVCGCAPSAQRAVDSSDWLARAEREIASREYRATQTAAGLQAPNRAHDLRTFFAPEGVRVHDRRAPDDPALVSLALARLGRGTELAEVPAGVVTNEGARVEIRRAEIVEWFVNGEAGLEQGFTLAERPSGDGALVLELAIDRARAKSLGDAVLLETSAGRNLAYGKLAANDAAGRALGARLVVASADRIQLVIDDADARYPLVIDPLLTSAADTLLESNEAGAFFGVSVSGAGDVNGDGFDDVIVGASRFDAGAADGGAAFVFLGSATGMVNASVSNAATQLVSDEASANFGISVAGAGDVNGDGYADVIVGADLYGAGDEGAAFVFLGGATGVVSATAADAAKSLLGDQPSSSFGYSVARAGDVNGDGIGDVIVGAYLYDSGETDEGAAFVFHGSPTGVTGSGPLTANARLEADQENAGSAIGIGAAGDVNGDFYDDVVFGAASYDGGIGRAFVFLGGPSGVGNGNPTNADTTFTVDSGGATVGLGYSIAGAGDVNGDGYADVIVGAGLWGDSDEGAVFIFHGSPTGIPSAVTSAAQGQLFGDQADGYFGANVAGAGDVNGDGRGDVIVGARYYSYGTSHNGAAFVFRGGASGIPAGGPSSAYASLSSSVANSEFGFSTAAAGDIDADGFDDVIVGALAYSNDSGTLGEGGAFVYRGSGSGPGNRTPATAAARFDSLQNYANLGQRVASAGDVNADGFDDIIIGAPGYDAGAGQFSGAAFVFLGGPNGIADGTPSSASALISGDRISGFASSVAGAGDVNGDGYDDIIAGAPDYELSVTNYGAAFIFLGGPSGVTSGSSLTAATRLEEGAGYGSFGTSVAGAGDVNGDGFADVIVGSPYYSSGQSHEGAVFVFFGSRAGIANGTTATAATRLESDQVEAAIGSSVAGAGDVDGDGFADVIVGAQRYSAGQAVPGAAFIFRGSASGISSGSVASAATHLESDIALSDFGYVVAGAGDVNADGYADVLVVAPSKLSSAIGNAYLFLGSASGVASGLAATAATRVQTPSGSFADGTGAGDVDGDGYTDIALGAPGASDPFTFGGAAYWFRGADAGIPNGTNADAAAKLVSDLAGAQIARSVAGAGDVNGDGFADLLAGIPTYPPPTSGTSPGRAVLWLGNGNSTGRLSLARQRRADGSHKRIAPFGTSHSLDSFDVSLDTFHPDGRGRAKLEVETCGAGVAFGHPSCVTSLDPEWTEVAPGDGLTLARRVSGLTPGTLYRWRARVQYAPFEYLGVVTRTKIGRWQRPGSQRLEGDVRTSRDTDTDAALDEVDGCPYFADPGQEDGGGFGTLSAPDGVGDACQCGHVAGDGRVDGADVIAFRQSLANPAGAALSPAAQTRCRVYGTSSSCDLVQVAVLRRTLHVPTLAPVSSPSLAQVCAPALAP